MSENIEKLKNYYRWNSRYRTKESTWEQCVQKFETMNLSFEAEIANDFTLLTKGNGKFRFKFSKWNQHPAVIFKKLVKFFKEN